ncbi:MAG: hypothetical protein K1X79_09900 [Oligoflexia bacterium]|nr:hypothetical protein [Oligoflexia bacterium]
MQGATRVISRNSLFAAILVGLYVLSFSLPFVLTFRVSDLFSSRPTPRFDEEALFPEATPISSQGMFLEAQALEAANPATGKDFVFFFWARLSRLPRNSEKLLLAAKSQLFADKQDGYVIGLSRDGDLLRPIVYWGNEQAGRWYQFAPIDIYQGQWVLLALTFASADGVLGLHAVDYDPRGAVQVHVLGGYEVESHQVASSSASLKMGAWGANRFRGKFGPFGVFSGDDVLEDFKAGLKEYARHPYELLSQYKKNARLWAPTSRNDLGPTQAKLELVSPSRRTNQEQ